MITLADFGVMKACNEEWDISDLTFPVFVTPKLDGIRAFKFNSLTWTTGKKRIPNNYIRNILNTHLVTGLDGEIVTLDSKGNPDSYHTVESKVMSEHGEPKFAFYIFDICHPDMQMFKYSTRMEILNEMVLPDELPNVKLIPRKINNAEELYKWEEQMLEHGYEGLIIRSSEARYKMGRATKKEGSMFKLCRWERREAIITGVTELQHNSDTSTYEKQNLTPGNTTGALECEDCVTGEPVIIGSGFNHSLGKDIWNNIEKYKGKMITYKHKIHGKKDKFRQPIFVGFRSDI